MNKLFQANSRIICPHCEYELSDDDMLRSDTDLFALAPNEDGANINCPSCKLKFWVRGGYKPEYETFKDEEDE